ncbi:SH3 domain-containing protein [Desulfobulbus sp. F4]|nr:SH3 domain-containing protein [Desulfobulbus sp. F4]
MKHRTFAARAGMLVAMLTLAAAASAAEFVFVVKDSVNVRSAPDTVSEVKFEAPANYPLQVLERKGEWIRVSDFENEQGWVSVKLVAKPSPYVIVKKKGNIRADAGTDSPIVGTVTREVILKKIDQQGDWIKVSHPQLSSGWIHRQLVWP